jgi:signal peptidase I
MANAFRWSGYALAIVLMTFSVLSFSGTVKARVVLTGSMIPAINPGDIVLTTPVKNVTPKVGSVVAYVGGCFFTPNHWWRCHEWIYSQRRQQSGSRYATTQTSRHHRCGHICNSNHWTLLNSPGFDDYHSFDIWSLADN